MTCRLNALSCNSDREGGSDSDQHAERGNRGNRDDDDEKDAEDILAAQARARESAAVDVSNALFGAVVIFLAKNVAKDVVASLAPKQVRGWSVGSSVSPSTGRAVGRSRGLGRVGVVVGAGINHAFACLKVMCSLCC